MAAIDTLALSVAWPPTSADHCLRVAAEHLAYETAEALHASGTSITFQQYAADLAGAATWWFWWD